MRSPAAITRIPLPSITICVTTVDFEPLSIAVPLWEDPPGVFRVGRSRVLLELVLRAFQRGESPERIVRSFRELALAEVYSVIGPYLAPRSPRCDYLRICDDQKPKSGFVKRSETSQRPPRPTKRRELKVRGRQRAESVISFLVDQNFNELLVAAVCLSPDECRDIVRYFPL